jgi:hypothetical protein
MADGFSVDPVALLRHGGQLLAAGKDITHAQRAQRSDKPLEATDFGNSDGAPAMYREYEAALQSLHSALDVIVEVLQNDAERLQLSAFSYHETDRWEGARHRPPPGRL